MKAFLDFNRKEIALGIAPCTFGAIVSLGLGVTTTDLSFAAWCAVCYAVFVVTDGYWVWAIFDNHKLDALQKEIDDLVADIEATEDPYLAGEVRRVLNGEEAQ